MFRVMLIKGYKITNISPLVMQPMFLVVLVYDTTEIRNRPRIRQMKVKLVVTVHLFVKQ